jgi:ATP-dependent DNA helicase RecG
MRGVSFLQVGDLFNRFYKECLPFDLTNAQKRVLKEIRSDVLHGAHMNRLIQGDVGSGKTIVALLAALLAIDNGFQSCIMAPTEILANQHFESIKSMLERLPVNVALLTGSTKTAARRKIHEDLLSGELHLLIGTHALLEPIVAFKSLGIAIIDEQHRFGVAQRATLWKKAKLPPHVLVMTATPIPRTLAMTYYGDLDISVIDELPPGRKPILTVHRHDSARAEVFGFMESEIAKGRQVYIVYPLIETSEAMDYKDLIDGYESVCRRFPRPQYQVSIVHGKMRPEAKEFEMSRFVKGETQIMVATTVIEVGVNVPNASVMVIESAERFGLSQLHQLRGRVGRGAEKSYCILMSADKLSEDARTRIQTMIRTNDGFEIAETDLELRGPGDILGTQQSGMPEMKIADISRDKDILKAARDIAQQTLDEDPELEKSEHAVVKAELKRILLSRPNWSRIS